MDGIAVRADDTVGASETSPVCSAGRRVRGGRHRRPAAGRLRRGDHARARAPQPATAPRCGPPSRRTSTSARSARTSARPSCCCPRGTGCGRSTPPRAPPPASSSSRYAARPGRRRADRRRDPPDRQRPAAGRDPGHQLTHARRAGPRGRLRDRVTGIVADDPDRDHRRAAGRGRAADLVILVAGSSAGRDDYTARVVAAAGTLAVHGVAVRPGHPVVLGTVDATPVLGAPGFPGVGGAHLRHLRRTAAGRARGRRAAAAAAGHGPAGPQAALRPSAWTTGSGSGSAGSAGEVVATPLPRGAGVLTSLVRADGLLVVPAGTEGHHAGERVSVELLRGRPRSTGRSSRSARTTSCSTSPPPGCGPPIR